MRMHASPWFFSYKNIYYWNVYNMSKSGTLWKWNMVKAAHTRNWLREIIQGWKTKVTRETLGFHGKRLVAFDDLKWRQSFQSCMIILLLLVVIVLMLLTDDDDSTFVVSFFFELSLTDVHQSFFFVDVYCCTTFCYGDIWPLLQCRKPATVSSPLQNVTEQRVLQCQSEQL